MVISSKKAALSALLKRSTKPPTEDQKRAAKQLKLTIHGDELPRVSWAEDLVAHVRSDAKRAAFRERAAARAATLIALTEAIVDVGSSSEAATTADLSVAVHSAHAMPAVQSATLMSNARDADDVGTGDAPADSSEAVLHLHIGSARPHAVDGDSEADRRQDGWAPAGSLRRLESEVEATLASEGLPNTNSLRVTDPEPPPSPFQNPPGPFTTEQLIPNTAQLRVAEQKAKIVDVLKRAARGKQGWAVAKRLRPEALILEEHEALNPCGYGYTWRKRADEDLWDAVQPSSWPDSPPDCSLNVQHILAEARALGVKDEQLLSWIQHGFPGARGMPRGVAVIACPHVGALKHPQDYEAMNERDVQNGFVTSGEEFPSVWPCRVDPMNIVVQHGKPRLTIDKRMRLSSSTHPEEVAAYNDFIDLEKERELVGRLQLPMVWMFTRGVAILQTAGVTVKVGKYDLSTFFRMHGKQRLHIFQSGRLFERSMFGHDLRVNFGERDAPDHTCRASDMLCFFVRVELKRLDAEYPSKASSVLQWLLMRAGLAEAEGSRDAARDFTWAALFFFLYFVDDAGLATIDDALYDKQGRPVMILETRADGSTVRRQQHRAELYFRAAMNIVRLCGHETPLKKQSAMDLWLEFLGVHVDLVLQKRLLSLEKRRLYRAHVQRVQREAKRLPSGGSSIEYDAVNSLVHKLLSASEVVPIGRQHLYHLRKALKASNHLHGHKVIFGNEAEAELEWWDAQLQLSEQHGLPLASRWDFPCSSDSTIVHYGDASREEGNLIESGAGAWAVIKGVFVYIEFRWSEWEIAHFSINVLETIIKDAATFTFAAYARSVGCAVTHSLAYVDNTTAEHVAEFGRTQSDALHALNMQRQARLVAEGIHQATERVASVDNDVADMLSRNALEEALRFPRSAGLPVLRLEVDAAARETASLPTTWA